MTDCDHTSKKSLADQKPPQSVAPNKQEKMENFAKEFPGFSTDQVEEVVDSRVDTGLINFKRCGEEISEEDPLLYGVARLSDEDVVNYLKGGNYAINPASAGYLPWPGNGPPYQGPLPPNVDEVPDNALGKFISRQPGVTDKSGGMGLVFYFENNAVVHNVSTAIRQSRQFQRISVGTAATIPNVVAAPALVQFRQLERLNGAPLPLTGFGEL